LTKVTYSRKFEKQLGKTPGYIREKAHLWIFNVRLIGIAEVSKSPGYHDEALKGSLQGYRSVRMNKAYRLIYRVIEDGIYIELLEIHRHEY
jgi:proteic killer suppression protein